MRLARETGTLSELALALSARTPVLVFCGELSAAASAVAETQSVQEATGISSAPYGALILAAWRGDEREAHQLIESTIREAGARGEGIGLAIAEYARAVLCNGLGQYEEALVAARSASEHREVVAENWGLSELIEPAARTGRTDLATEATESAGREGASERNRLGARNRGPLASAAERRRRRPKRLFREAIERLSRTPHARRAGPHASAVRRVASPDESPGRRARRAGRGARDVQRDGHGSSSPSARAASSWRPATIAHKRNTETRDDLTAQEAQIARLARDGLSNPEIGAQLFLSPRTVEWHLRKVFAKLGISSRRQLRAALSEDGRPVARLSD